MGTHSLTLSSFSATTSNALLNIFYGNSDPNGSVAIEAANSYTGAVDAVGMIATYYSATTNNTPHNVPNLVGMEVDSNSPTSGGGTATNNIGINIENQTGGANNWAIKTGLGKVGLGDSLEVHGDLGFFATAPVAQQTVTGSKGGNAALASLLTALATYGLITDSST